MWGKDQSSFHLRCEEDRNPLHFAAYIDYVEGVNYLLDIFWVAAYQRDKNGLYPIHIASNKGHINIIQEMLQCCPDLREVVNQQGQNILHVAAKSGKAKAVSYMLKMPELMKLINKRDKEGNTPLHLATIYGYPKIVSTLTCGERVNLKLENNEGLTALDIAEEYMETNASFRKQLTWMALRVAGSPRSPHSKVFKGKRKICRQGESHKLENCKDKVNVILLVATLVATVTFAAGFTIPGGYDNSGVDQGMATMIGQKNFHVFVITDTIAMYSSIIVAVTLIWAHLGLYLVVSKLHWLAKVVSFMGISFLIILLALFFPLCFLASSNLHLFRHISCYPFLLVLFAFGSLIDEGMAE